MKIISFYIRNFGKLSNYEMKMDSKLTTIFEKNGYGKTTITAFIKAMLYGFNETTKDIKKNPRYKYAPWNKGSYGGSLEIEIENETYRIEREFNPNKANNDTVKIINLATNKQINDFSISSRILGLSEESFERSVYIPQKELEISFNKDLKSKLANLIGGTNDVQNFSSANQIIVDKYKSIKKTKATGLYFDQKSKLLDLEQKLRECDNASIAIEVLKKEVESDNLLLEKLNKVNKILKGKLQLSGDIKYYNNLRDKLALEEKKVQEAKEIFKDKSPSDVPIDELDALILDYNIEAARLASYKSSNNNTEYLELKKIFENKPSIEQLDNIKKEIGSLNNENVINKPKSIYQFSFLGLGCILLIIGIIMMFNNILIGSILLGLGFVFACVFGFMYFAFNNKSKEASLKKQELENKLVSFFVQYGYSSNDYSENLRRIKNQLDRLEQYEETIKIEEVNQEELTTTLNTNKLKIDKLLADYNLGEGTYQTKLNFLKGATFKYSNILKNKAEIEKSILDFTNKHSMDDLESLNTDTLQKESSLLEDEIRELIISITSKINKIEGYKELIENKDFLADDYDNLKEEIISLEKEYDLLKTASELLNEANESLTAKYVKPMQDSVSKYLSILLEEDKRFSIDIDFNFNYIEDGESKELEFYSKGYQQLIMLSMRMAIVEILFPNEKPFLIFDDPFVNFDQEKLEKTKKLLDKLKEKYQIIYFTCHESRII